MNHFIQTIYSALKGPQQWLSHRKKSLKFYFGKAFLSSVQWSSQIDSWLNFQEGTSRLPSLRSPKFILLCQLVFSLELSNLLLKDNIDSPNPTPALSGSPLKLSMRGTSNDFAHVSKSHHPSEYSSPRKSPCLNLHQVAENSNEMPINRWTKSGIDVLFFN